jgi:hypothetical protein
MGLLLPIEVSFPRGFGRLAVMTREAQQHYVAALIQRPTVSYLLDVVSDHRTNSGAPLTTPSTLSDDCVSEISPFLGLIEVATDTPF